MRFLLGVITLMGENIRKKFHAWLQVKNAIAGRKAALRQPGCPVLMPSKAYSGPAE